MARRSGATSLSRPAAYIRHTSINKGLFGENRLWRVVFVIIFGRKLLRRMMGSEPETVAIEKLKPGQFVSIEAIDPQTLDERRKGRRRRR
jgi:hypothetical protein